MKLTRTMAVWACLGLSYDSLGLTDSNLPPAVRSGATNLSATVPGQTLTPEEAELALKRLKRGAPGPGTWRRTEFFITPDKTTTNDFCEQRLLSGGRFMRKEVTAR